MNAARTSRDVLWDACRSKTCCRTTRVVLTGRDLVELMRTFELEPAQFAMHMPVAAGDPTGFLLDPQGVRYELALRKNGEIGPAGAPCVFLVQTNDGHASCGAGTSRPAVCLAYPATVSEGRLRIAGAACSCRRWSLLDLDAEERELASAGARQAEENAELVAAWNAEIRVEGAARSIDDYYRHLVGAYHP